MSVIEVADKVYAGAVDADSVYQGDTKVWSSAPPQVPATIPNLAVWLDADQLKLANGAPVPVWPDVSGRSINPVLLGSPAPKVRTYALNSQSVVRFSVSEGSFRWYNDTTGADGEWTILYVSRMVGTTGGRVLGAVYPPRNALFGYWNGYEDAFYDSGFPVVDAKVPQSTKWHLYSADCLVTNRYFSDGNQIGEWSAPGGLGGTLAISGYDPGTSAETCDCEVAEVCLYSRKLTDPERKQVEDYLRQKWLPLYDPATVAYLAATGLPTTYAPALNSLVTGLKMAGLWSKMKAIYPFVGGTEALHKWNLKDPRDTDDAYRLTFVAATGTHTTALGYRPNPAPITTYAPGHADTHFVPSVAFSDVNSTHLALYSLADQPAGDRCDMGCYMWNGSPGARFHIIARYNGDQFYYGMSEEDGTSVTVPGSSGLFVSTRIAADNQSGYRNGVRPDPASPKAPTNGLPNASVLIGAISGYTQGPSDLPFGFASIGSGLTPQENADLYYVVQTYQTALGRQVGSPIQPVPPDVVSTMPGLALRLEADSIADAADGAQITSWPDRGPHHYPVTPSPTAPVWKQAGVNGRPSVYFNSSSRLLISGWGDVLSGKSEYTLFHVMTAENPGTDPVVLTAPLYNIWQWLTEVSSANAGFYWGHGNGSYNMFAANISSTAASIVTCSLALPGAGGPKVYKNSVQIASAAQGSQGPLQQTVPAIGSDVYLGAYYNGALGIAGHIAAIIYYDRFLIDSDRQKIEAYLMAKYGIGTP